MRYHHRLDSLRAVFAGVIVLYHCHCPGFGWGWLGVPFFFTLSGYVVTASLRRDDHLPRFYARRARRILPAYAALALAFTAAYLATGNPKHWGASGPWVAAFSSNFAQVFAPSYHLDFWGHTWSLAVEAQFYIFWPLLLRRVPLARACLVLCLVSLLLRPLTLLATSLASGRVDDVFMLPTYHLDAFALGAALNLDPVRAAIRGPLARFLVPAVVLAWGALSLWRFPSQAWDTFGYVQKNPDLAHVVLGGTITAILAAFIIARETGGPASGGRWSDSPLLQNLGRISYGIYLYHVPVLLLSLKFVAPRLPSALGSALPLALGLLVLLLSIVAAGFSYRLVERPFLDRKNTRAPAPAPDLAATS